MVCSHRCSAEEGTPVPLLPKMAEDVWNEPSILKSFYTCIVESILTGCITAWFGNSTAGNRRALQRVVRTAATLLEVSFPDHQRTPATRPTDRSLLPSGRRLRSIRSRTSQLRDSFFPSGYQANEQSEIIHPTAHSHFTECHALHFNFNTVQLDYTHTLDCTLTFTQFNWTTCTQCTNTKKTKTGGSNAHP